MLEINIKEVKNGYTLEVKGSTTSDGLSVAKKTEEIQLIQNVGRLLIGNKIKVELQ